VGREGNEEKEEPHACTINVPQAKGQLRDGCRFANLRISAGVWVMATVAWNVQSLDLLFLLEVPECDLLQEANHRDMFSRTFLARESSCPFAGAAGDRNSA
jgi:hypothetical protein